MTAALNTFDIMQLGEFDQLLDLFCDLFKNESGLCRQFWEHDYRHPRRRVLFDIALNNFPFQLDPFIRLITALAGDADCARQIFGYLQVRNPFLLDSSSISQY
jgi:hypothetical protein